MSASTTANTRLHRVLKHVAPSAASASASAVPINQHATSSSIGAADSLATAKPVEPQEQELKQPTETVIIEDDPKNRAEDGSIINPLGEKVRWNGWGYNDTEFKLNENGRVTLTGQRYLFSGKELLELRGWMETMVGIDIKDFTPSQEKMRGFAPAIRQDAFVTAVNGHCDIISFDEHDRIFHAHGHTCQEIYDLRFGRFARIPDCVIYPGCHEHVEAIVKLADEHDIVLIPFGGGTSVTQALVCPENEKRMIVSLDMKRMNRIKWVNHKSMMACIEAGAVGKHLETQLNRYSLCLGHEPDSSEFSTMGGWIATKASGMKKNKYGNIEDIVVKIKIVTPKGTFEKGCMAPRVSTGPDLDAFIIGSEGTLGVVTEVVVRLRPLPKVRVYGSMIFPDFESGVSCLHEIAIKRAQPVSIRLVDNMQFQFGQALKPPNTKWHEDVSDIVKKWYVTKYSGFDKDKMVAATLLFEGASGEVREQERRVYEIAAKYGGMKAGKDNGIRGYFLTYMIAYLRDFGFNYRFIAESFETSMPWDKVLPVCQNVKEKIREVAASEGVKTPPFISCRVTQLYDTGACVYFYFGFICSITHNDVVDYTGRTGIEDPVKTFSVIEHEARNEIIRLGGSLSHHHGIGKLRKHWMKETVSGTGMKMLKGLKDTLDPNNIFANDNLI